MFCTSCGNNLKDGAKFCPKCGCAIVSDAGNTPPAAVTPGPIAPQPNEKTEMIERTELVPPIPAVPPVNNAPKKSGGNGLKIGLLIGLIAVILMLAGTAAYLFLSDNSPISGFFNNDISGYLKKAEDAMAIGEYDEAIGYYKAALEIDNTSEDIYEGLAKAYHASGKLDNAIETLETGIEITGSSKLSDLLDKYKKELESGEGATNDGSSDGTDTGESETGEEIVPFTGERKNVDIEVRQVDNTDFPQVTLYASVTDEYGNAVENLNVSDFDIQEIDRYGNVVEAKIDDIYQVMNSDKISIELVMDASGSMSDYNKMGQAQNAAAALVEQMDLTSGDQVEVISFDDYVYLQQEFTNNENALVNAIYDINMGNMTALYDGIYAGLYQTNLESGSKCVIAFTDGMENASSYSFDDVVDMARNTGIPVFIIGIGSYSVDEYALEDLATQCSGKYYSASEQDLESILEDIYITIYTEQKNYYVVKYTTTDDDNRDEFREVVLQTSEASEFVGYYKKAYIPESDIYGAFSGDYSNVDFILDYSSDVQVTEADLEGLSLAQLRIARNEIFARHGRQFKDPLLNQWFYSKAWYLNIGAKYSPSDFDTYGPNPLSKLEQQNAEFIKSYEQDKMDTEDIFPNASFELLSEYDLALSKPVLKEALKQMKNYSQTDILKQNIELVQDEIDKEDVSY